MSRRRRRRLALRDALALVLAKRVQRELPGSHDVGLAITDVSLGGVRVAARVDDARAVAWIPVTGVQMAIDKLATNLIDARASR